MKHIAKIVPRQDQSVREVHDYLPNGQLYLPCERVGKNPIQAWANTTHRSGEISPACVLLNCTKYVNPQAIRRK